MVLNVKHEYDNYYTFILKISENLYLIFSINNLHAVNMKVAIFETRLFYDIYGLLITEYNKLLYIKHARDRCTHAYNRLFSLRIIRDPIIIHNNICPSLYFIDACIV